MISGYLAMCVLLIQSQRAKYRAAINLVLLVWKTQLV